MYTHYLLHGTYRDAPPVSTTGPGARAAAAAEVMVETPGCVGFWERTDSSLPDTALGQQQR